MPLITRLMVALSSFIVLATIVRLVRGKQLDEQYALLWLVAGVTVLILPLATRPIDVLSNALGFHYAPAFVLLIGFLALCLINLQYSVAISRLSDHNKRLAQKFALLE